MITKTADNNTDASAPASGGNAKTGVISDGCSASTTTNLTGSTSTATSSTASSAASSSSRLTPSAAKTKFSLRSSLTKPSARMPRKRAKVSFSQEVIKNDDNGGDGSKVVIKEEHGIFLGPLLGRMTMSPPSSDQEEDEGGSTNGAVAAKNSPTPMISFAMDSHTIDKLSYSESSHGILNQSNTKAQPLGDGNVEYDNLVVCMGLLKCGQRYRAVVPVPDYWKQKYASDANIPIKEDTEEVEMMNLHEPYSMDVRIVEDSLDGDLKGEVLKEYTEESSTGTLRQHHVSITLSARQRGQYRGRFVLELTRLSNNGTESQSKSSANEETVSKSDSDDAPLATTQNTNSNDALPRKCLMSLQVDATVMGKDMGTPKLRNGVYCLGKMVGYDSDEETEWQGFD